MTGEVTVFLPDFAPVLQYFTDQVMIFGSNPLISFFIAGLVGRILSVLPAFVRKFGMGISILVSVGLVRMISVAGSIHVGMRGIVMLGLILGVVTSKGYDFFKGQYKEQFDVVSDEEEKEDTVEGEELIGDMPNALFDEPDPQDYPFEEIFGSVDDLPEELYLGNEVDTQNQGIKRTPSTHMACGSYGVGHASNVMNNIEGSDTYIHCHQLWRDFVNVHKKQYAEQYGIDPIKDGSYLQHQVNYAMKRGYIAGYTKLKKEAKWIEQALNRKNIIYTGSSRINRPATKRNGNIAVIGAGSGHAFEIDGYSKTHFRCRNSYGPHYMDHGYFWLRKEDVGALFSIYSLVDKKDIDKMKEWKEKIAKIHEKLSNGGKPEGIYEHIIWRNFYSK